MYLQRPPVDAMCVVSCCSKGVSFVVFVVMKMQPKQYIAHEDAGNCTSRLNTVRRGLTAAMG